LLALGALSIVTFETGFAFAQHHFFTLVEGPYDHIWSRLVDYNLVFMPAFGVGCGLLGLLQRDPAGFLNAATGFVVLSFVYLSPLILPLVFIDVRVAAHVVPRWLASDLPILSLVVGGPAFWTISAWVKWRRSKRSPVA
jgi:hypothetical protein